MIGSKDCDSRGGPVPTCKRPLPANTTHGVGLRLMARLSWAGAGAARPLPDRAAEVMLQRALAPKAGLIPLCLLKPAGKGEKEFSTVWSLAIQKGKREKKPQRQK